MHSLVSYNIDAKKQLAYKSTYRNHLAQGSIIRTYICLAWLPAHSNFQKIIKSQNIPQTPVPTCDMVKFIRLRLWQLSEDRFSPQP